MEETKKYFDSWFKTQQRIFGSLAEMTGKYQESFWGLRPNGEGAFGLLPNVFTSWNTAVLNALREAGKRGALSETAGGSSAYLNLYEIWVTLVKSMQEKTLDPTTYRDLMDPKKYKEILDRVFGFDPDVITQVAAQASKLLEAYSGSSQHFIKPWIEAAEKNMKTLPQFVEGRPQATMQAYHNLFNAFDGTVGKFFHIPPVGKDREKIELILRTLDDISVYSAKLTEFQHTMYVTGMAALEKVITAVTEKGNKGEDIKGFEEFFDLWVDINEKTYFELFQSREFSRMQGELLETGLQLRQHNFKLMELYLYDYPIALRSEMDDLYKTIYELKKKVRSLEKQFGEVAA